MFEIVDFTILNIALVYIAFISSCLLMFPIVHLIMAAVGRGTDQWR